MIEFDPDKDKINMEKHGISLAEAVLIDWDETCPREDKRKDYGEKRMVALAPIRERLYSVVYVEKEESVLRIISLRKANKREYRGYVQKNID